MANLEEEPAGPGHWSKDRLHADVQRAVGGSFNLVREFCRLSFEIDSATSVDWMIRRTQFFGFELRTLITEEADDREKLEILNDFFFDSKRFRCIEDLTTARSPLNSTHFGRALVDRTGSPVLIAALYRYLAEQIGLTLEVVDFRPSRFLRWNEAGRARFVDITKKGAVLSCDELIDCLHEKFNAREASAHSVLEVSPFEMVISDYIGDLKTAIKPGEEFGKLLFLQNALVSYQPSNVALLADRAVLHRRLGQFKNALSDLKRYFTFFDKSKCSKELNDLHDDLVRITSRVQL
ncbi:MAG: transglutaminase family protein [Bdellovibrionota bacterium]